MPQSVKLSDELIKQARQYGEVYHRSTAKQIEYWSTIGKISEENPDLPYRMRRHCTAPLFRSFMRISALSRSRRH